MSKSMEMTCTPPSQFHHWTCIVNIPGNTIGNPFLATTWRYGLRGCLCAFSWSPAQGKSAWTDTEKLTEHFGTKYGWTEDYCEKNRCLKLGLLGCPLRLQANSNLKSIPHCHNDLQHSETWRSGVVMYQSCAIVPFLACELTSHTEVTIHRGPTTFVAGDHVEIACLPLASVSKTRSEVTLHQNANINSKKENSCSFGCLFAFALVKTPLK